MKRLAMIGGRSVRGPDAPIILVPFPLATERRGSFSATDRELFARIQHWITAENSIRTTRM
jgi:hypothetical protein